MQECAYTFAVTQLFRVIIGATDTQEIFTYTIKDPLLCLTTGERHYVLKASLGRPRGCRTHM